jgi:hypothetical protein
MRRRGDGCNAGQSGRRLVARWQQQYNFFMTCSVPTMQHLKIAAMGRFGDGALAEPR